MAIATVVESDKMCSHPGMGGVAQIMQGPWLAEHDLDSEEESSAFNANTRFITITAISALRFATGSSPSVTTSTGMHLPAGTIFSIGVKPGHTFIAISAA